MQNISLGIEDEPVALTPSVGVQVATINRFSLVVVPINPRKQNHRAMINQFPRVWGVDSVVGCIIAANHIQFIFQSEEAMLSVLRRSPWSFAEWMVFVHRWYPNIDSEELKIIPLCV